MEKQKKAKPISRKRYDMIQLVAGLLILVAVNYLGSRFFSRIDLTADKRYSLTEATIDRLENLEDIVFVKVYLDGDLPADFQRLRNATKEILDEFRAYAGDNIQYEFIDPSDFDSEKRRNEMYQDLSDRGLRYTNIRTSEGDKRSEQIIFPGAIIKYQDKEEPLQLMTGSAGSDPQNMANNSVQQLEYGLMSSVKKLTQYAKKRVGIIQGNGEADELQLADVTKSLEDFYIVDPIEIDGKLDALKLQNAIIIPGLTEKLSEKDKYMIDQFIMKGGKVLWFVDGAKADMDSVRAKGITMALPNEVNLEDQLFKYGVRVNYDLVQDMQDALPIPIVTGMVGNQPRQEMMPWYYHPLIRARSKHPIVNNLDPIKCGFVSSIDFVGSEESKVKKTPLLTTSKYSKVSSTPHRISLNVLRSEPDKRQFNKPHRVAAALLEGEFESLYKNRITHEISKNPDFNFLEKSTPTKMIVVSDADIIKNDVDRKKEVYYDLGYHKYNRRVYSNKQFVLNAVNYLLDNDGLIYARAKDFKLRLLDKQRIKEDKRRLQILNTALPVILIVIFGAVRYYIRRKINT